MSDLPGDPAHLAGPRLSSQLLHRGERFFAVLVERVFVLRWTASPRADDVDTIGELAAEAHHGLGRRLVELVFVPKGMTLGLDEVRATERMVERFPRFAEDFEALFMILEGDSFAFEMLRRSAALIASLAHKPWTLGRKVEVLRAVAEREGLEPTALERLLELR